MPYLGYLSPVRAIATKEEHRYVFDVKLIVATGSEDAVFSGGGHFGGSSVEVRLVASMALGRSAYPVRC
jgi:hypothetical protein